MASRQLRLGLYCLLGFLSSPLLACPSGLLMQDLKPRLRGPREGTRIFVLPEGAPANAWQDIVLEVNPIDADGHLVFFPDESWRHKDLVDTDLLMFGLSDFGRPMQAAEDLPCRGNVVYKLRDDSTQRVAYLTNCGAYAKPTPRPQPVKFDEKNGLLATADYRYEFHPRNYMQFKSISFANAAGGWDQAAYDSRLLIKADVKNFFTLQFDSREIESQLEANRLGAIGDLARLSFYLRVLFFKIRMSLSTDVGFFADSAHIPMMVSIPVDAYKHLNPASGILYSWLLSPAVGKHDVHMPRMDAQRIKRGWQSLANDGIQYCKGDQCSYHFAVDLLGRRLSMDFTLEKRLVERGFYPIFVDEVARHQSLMGWDTEGEETEAEDTKREDTKGEDAKQKAGVDKTPAGPRIGMYFEVSGLSEGGHPWDFWLQLGARDRSRKQGDKSVVCPAPFHYSIFPPRVTNPVK